MLTFRQFRIGSDRLAQRLTQVQFRLAQHDDLPHIERLRQERWVLLCQSDGRFRQQQPGDIRAWLTSPECDLWVGAKQSEGEASALAGIIGYVTAWHTTSPYGRLPDDMGLIDELALDAHQYHAGLGRGLVERARHELNARQKRHIIACVPRYHAVEQAFWRALGAVEWEAEAPTLPLSAPPTSIWMAL